MSRLAVIEGFLGPMDFPSGVSVADQQTSQKTFELCMQEDPISRVEIRDEDDDPIWWQYNQNIDAMQKQQEEKEELIQEARKRRELREQSNSLGILAALISIAFAGTLLLAGDGLFASQDPLSMAGETYRRRPPVVDANQLLQNDFLRLDSSVEFGKDDAEN